MCGDKKNQKNNIVIYTAIAGGVDQLKQHTYISKEFDYVCFTDTRIDNPGVWDIRPMNSGISDSVRKAKYFKIFPDKVLPEYAYSFWIDGNIDVLGPALESRIHDLINSGCMISANKHSVRTCVYEEADACILFRKDDPDLIRQQMEYIKKTGFPHNAGLYEMFMIFRQHNDELVKKIMEDWWNMIVNFSRRDQLSFTYVLLKNNAVCEQLFEENIRYRSDFSIKPHAQRVHQALYVDTGKGFREKEVIVNDQWVLNGENRLKSVYDLSSFTNAVGYRFHPVINGVCRVKFNKIEFDKNGITTDVSMNNPSVVKSVNGWLSDDGYYDFRYVNPLVVMSFPDSVSVIRIEYILVVLGFDDKLRLLSETMETLDRTDKELKSKLSEINRIYRSYTWKTGKVILTMPIWIIRILRKVIRSGG